ncbi:zf-HC2 domain-containing protein [Micromonospora sp. WMMD1120]|uniref:zf-HC2 domain-containing protein n=1 Tax=Micromonospora sp. WMMD1120 TaxID=3016106 RepID=UPI002417437B|nr:zf-HC2 domain-containing protein [Micromonospora sp. WMMD1120]MDG4809478.1 zf-HC2 domain-containing protein [Micromonospora sp. WMMD1120]
MGDIGCEEPELRGKIALYVTGRISGSEQWEVEEHLAHCADCLEESRILGDAVLALAVLGEADRRELVADFGVPVAATTAHGGARPAGSSAPRSRDDADRRPSTRPSGPGRPGSRSGRRRPRKPMLAAGGLVLVVLLAIGGVLGQSVLNDAPPPVALVADSGGSASGAVLSVTVSPDGGDAAIRATVSGLEAGRSYRFYVTDVAGNSYDIAGLTGTGQAQDLTGACPVPLDRLERFSVTAADGALVVAATVRRTGSTPAATG